MYRKLGSFAAVLGIVAVGFAGPARAAVVEVAPPSTAGMVDAPRSATISEVVQRGPYLVTITGEAVEADDDPGDAWTNVAGTCQGAVSPALPPMISATSDDAAAAPKLDVVCYLYDVTEDIRYMYSAWYLGQPVHANWTAWTLPDHRLQLCVWAGLNGEEWDMFGPRDCVDMQRPPIRAL